MPDVSIDQLFDSSRFPRSGLALLVLICYIPIGVLLAFIRIFVGLHAFIVSSILPKAWLLRCIALRVMCGILGVIVIQENSEVRDRNVKVIVSNFTTQLDHVAMELVHSNVMPSMWDLPATMMWLLGYEDMGAKHGRETLVQNAKRHCQNSPFPLLAFPEGASTNGKVGLLKFSVWPFSLDEIVQPIVMQVTRPSFVSLSPSVAGSWWWTDIFWFLFVPYSCFRLRVLPAMAQLDDETPQEFSVRVQKSMAEALSLSPTPYTSADKIELIKRNERTQTSGHRQPRADKPIKGAVNSEMDILVDQVKNVLPHVPSLAIQRDLCLTKDVDLTITNILEGRVQYKAEQPAVEADRTASPTQLTPTPVPSKTIKTPHTNASQPNQFNAAVSFGRTSAQRHMTFAERKKALIDAARQRYIEKHSMPNMTSSLD